MAQTGGFVIPKIYSHCGHSLPLRLFSAGFRNVLIQKIACHSKNKFESDSRFVVSVNTLILNHQPGNGDYYGFALAGS